MTDRNASGGGDCMRSSASRRIAALAAGSVILLLCCTSALQAASMPTYERLQPITANLNAPIAVAVDAVENVYVTQSIYNNLLIYDQSGGYLRALSGLDRPISVAVAGDGRILVGNDGRRNVEVYDANLSLLHKLGSGDGEFAKPSGIAVDSAGNAYVADSKADQIKVYHPDGTPAFTFGISGSAAGQLRFPAAISINDAAGELVVSDLPLIDSWSGVQEGARVRVFDMAGGFLRSFGEFGQGEGLLTKPLGVAVDGERRIYVSDAFQNVVQVFDGDGSYLGAVYDLDNPMRTPLGIAFGKLTGRLLIASLNTSRVEVYHVVGSAASLPCYDFIGGDNTVGLADVQFEADLWRQPADPPYDSDGDGTVTVVDIIEVAGHLGEPCD